MDVIFNMAKEFSSSCVERALSKAATKLSLELKVKQKEAVFSGRDTFVSLPTGYGKSAIYAVLPLVFDHLLFKSKS